MSEPPKLAERLLRRLVGGRDADAVAGDLRESLESRGRLWYWGQVLSCLAVRVSPHRRLLPGLGADFVSALRRIRRNPGYSVVAMLCLALAMGVNTTLFSFLHSMYFRRLPVPQASRLVQITRQESSFCNLRQFLRFEPDLRSVKAAGALVAFDSAAIGRVRVPLNVEMVTANFAGVLRLGTAAGRWFAPGDNSFNAEPVTVISHHFWKSRWNGAPETIGSSMQLHDKTYRIIGIAPEEFHGVLPPFAIDAWVPADSVFPAGAGPRLNLIARLAPGATPQTVAAEMRVLTSALRAAEPRDARLESPPVVKLAVGFIANRDLFLPLMKLVAATCAIVLLIACVNVANLLLSRAAVRRREMALRRSLGAGRWRLFRETLVEGLLLSAGGWLLGLLAGFWTSRAIQLALPSVPLSYFQGIQFGIDWRVALCLVAAGAACAVLFSLPPALAGSRNLSAAMHGSALPRRFRQRELYSLAQVTLSLTLLVAAGLLLRALDRVRHVDPGFATDHRVSVTARANSPKPEDAARAWTEVLDRARAMPGVRNATLSYGVFPGTGAACAAKSEAEAPKTINDARTIRINLIEPNYFAMMRVPILRGRGLRANEGSADAPEVVVSQFMARQWWPGADPLGQRLWLGCSPADRKIGVVVGVAGDTKTSTLNEDPAPVHYLLRRHNPGASYLALTIETAGDPRQWVNPLLKLAQDNPNLDVYEAQTLESAIARSLWLLQWQAALLAGLGLLAVMLAAIGLYGVVAYSVSQRTAEIGVRMALGAMPGDVQWMVLSQGLRITLAGVGAGLLLSAATVRLLRGFLYGLNPFDPMAFAAAALAWLLIAMLASWFPARRATRVDPLAALKYD